MCPGEQRIASGLEVSPGWSADVHEMWPPDVEQFPERLITGGSRQRGELPARGLVEVVNTDHNVRCSHAPQAVEVGTGHVARADERDSERACRLVCGCHCGCSSQDADRAP